MPGCGGAGAACAWETARPGRPAAGHWPVQSGHQAPHESARFFGDAGQFPGAGNLLVIEIEGGSHLHELYINMQTL